MSTYQIGWYVAVILFVINVAIAAIQTAYTSGHGADLGISPQVQAWLAIVSTVIAAALGLLPRVQMTPQARERSYLLASQGKLPGDLEAKYPAASPAAGGQPHIEDV